MNILVINISLRPYLPIRFFPIGLGYITTAMKNAGYVFDLLDIDAHRYTEVEVEKLIKRKKYDVVCMGCIVTGYKNIKWLASVVRQNHPACKIIVGNSVASSIVDILLNNTEADIAVIGEGDETIIELLQHISEGQPLEEVNGICFIENGRSIRTPDRPLIKDISNIPFIDFEIFDVDLFIEYSKDGVTDPLPIPRQEIRALPVNTARGCIADCTFCYHVFKRKPYRHRSADSIIREIKALIDKYNLNYIQFWDELTFFSKKQTVEFVEAIIDADLHFYWDAQSRANLFNDDEDIEIMKKMKKAGCIGMQYSLESADKGILKAMNKKISVEQFAKQTSLYRKAGIATYTSLVLGFPQETPETIKKTFDCCIENRIYPSVGYLLPQPGSPIYDYAIKEGFIKNEEEFLMNMGDRQDLRINITSMDDRQFENAVLMGVQRCSDELKLGLEPDKLIKTQHWRVVESL
jgi:anaerobic magnesium-protoporphyrin IX monomethyl ester cyclase